MSRILFLFVFYILHVWFFVDYFFYGIDYTEFLGSVQSYTYGYQIAVLSFGYILACFTFLIIGLYAKPIHLPFAFINPDRVVNLNRLFSGFRISMTVCICFMASLLSQAGAQIASSEFKESNNWIYEFRILPLIFLSFILLNGYRLKRIDKLLICIYASIAVLGLTRSLIVELFSIFFFYYALYLKNDKLKIEYVVITFLGIIFINIMASFRETTSWDAVIDNASALFAFEYKSYLDLQISEVIQNYNERGYYTFIDSSILIIPSFIRELFGIKMFYPDQELFFEIGRRSYPYYGGGFSLLAEAYLNLKYLAPILFLFIGYIINIVLISIKKSKAMNRFTVNAVFPLMIISIILSFRNGFSIHFKYVIQLYILAFLTFFFVTKKRKPHFVRPPKI